MKKENTKIGRYNYTQAHHSKDKLKSSTDQKRKLCRSDDSDSRIGSTQFVEFSGRI